MSAVYLIDSPPAKTILLYQQADIPGIVVEDAPSGIKSGVASGARVLAVCTSHKRKEIEGFGAEWIVNDLTK